MTPTQEPRSKSRRPGSRTVLAVVLLAGALACALLIIALRPEKRVEGRASPVTESRVPVKPSLQGRSAAQEADSGVIPNSAGESEAEAEAEFRLRIEFLAEVPDDVLLKGIVEQEDGPIHVFEAGFPLEGATLDARASSPVAGRLHLEVYAGDEFQRVTALGGVPIQLGRETDLGEVRFGRPAIYGRVLDADTQEPLTRLPVFLTSAATEQALDSSRTNYSGRFRFEPIGEPPWIVKVWSPLRYPRPQVRYDRASAEIRDILLRRLSPVRLQLHWLGTEVTPRHMRLSLQAPDGSYRSVMTDDEGIAWVSPGEYRIFACFEHSLVRASLGADLRATIDDAGVDLELEPEVSVEAGLLELVLDGEERSQVAPVQLMVRSEDRSDAAGQALALALETSEHPVRIALDPGNYSVVAGRVQDGEGRLSPPRSFSVAREQVVRVRLVLEEAGELTIATREPGTGWVRLATDAGGCWIHMTGGSDTRARLMRQTTRRPFGGLQLRALGLPGDWIVEAERDGVVRSHITRIKAGQNAILRLWE